METVTWKELVTSAKWEKHVDGSDIMDVRDTEVLFPGNEDLRGYTFANCDMSRFKGLNKSQFLSLGGVHECIAPRIVLDGSEDLPDCRGSDLVHIEGMSSGQLVANIGMLVEARPGFILFNGTESFKDLDLGGIDMRNLRGVRLSQVLQAKVLIGVKFGRILAGMFDRFEGRDLTECDMSEIINAKGEMYNGAASLDGAALPGGDFSKYIMAGKAYYATDFSRCGNMRWAGQMNEASELVECVMPFISIRRGDLSDEEGYLLPVNPIIRGADFGKVTNLGEKHAGYLKSLGAVNVRVREKEAPNLFQSMAQKKISQDAYLIERIICPPEIGKKYRSPDGIRKFSYDLAAHCAKTGSDPQKFAARFRGMDEALARKTFVAISGSRHDIGR